MNIEKGVSLASPEVDVPWSVTETNLLDLLTPVIPKRAVPGQVRARCALVEGLSSETSFHFDSAARFCRVEFRRRVQRHRQKGFDAWNTRLESWIGQGIESTDRTPNWKNWSLGRVSIDHIMHSDGVEIVDIVRR
jgi:hypothetical protein